MKNTESVLQKNFPERGKCRKYFVFKQYPTTFLCQTSAHKAPLILIFNTLCDILNFQISTISFTYGKITISVQI